VLPRGAPKITDRPGCALDDTSRPSSGVSMPPPGAGRGQVSVDSRPSKPVVTRPAGRNCVRKVS